jgi:hypothetical protein
MSKLKLSDWASVAEIVAAVAVAVSLVFVGLELQHNTAASESATREAINQKDIEYLSLYVDPAVLAVANAKAQNGETLSTLEESQLVAAEYVNFIIFEHSYYQFRKGVLGTEEWARHENIIRLIWRDWPYAHTMWSQYGETFSPDFVALMDRLKAERE